MKYGELISKMSLQEKAQMCSGADLWHFKSFEKYQIPSIMVSDGPHGLRTQHGKDMRVNVSALSTCFPTASASACSWNTELLTKVGAAIGEEARHEGVQIVLGPGVNIKRSPLCGRNFEYYSEDPLLAGEMGAAFIRGVQSKGVGACVKHFAANNQESYRNTINAVIDRKTLKEIYLKAFEIAVKKGKPISVMSSYNLVNGEHTGESEYLVKDNLRAEWGFDGLVMSDWGAVYDRVQGIKAGLDIEMPSSGDINEKEIIKAVESGTLDESDLDAAVDRILDVIFRLDKTRGEGEEYDIAAHDELARQVARESIVLLKNVKNTLPLKRKDKILVVGEFAVKPRFQGGGSSFINAHKITSLSDALKEQGVEFDYERGYDLRAGKDSRKLIAKAVERASAGDYDKIVVCAGLTEEYEAEGFDRKSIAMPPAHDELITKLCSTGKSVVVVLSAGAPVAMPWIDGVSGVLMAYLTGQNCGGACADILTGKTNPSGKLAETFPMSLDNLASSAYFPGNRYDVEYREGEYVGYRYTEKVDAPVLFPFGYGLSYTSYEYGELKVENNALGNDGTLDLSIEIKNTGDVDGMETVQLYASKEGAKGVNIKLIAFQKTEISKKSCKKISFSLDKNAFMVYDDKKGWICERGDYRIIAASNVREPKQQVTISIDGEDSVEIGGWYARPDSKTPISDEDFIARYGSQPVSRERNPVKGSFTIDDCFEDMAKTSGFARFVLRVASFGIRAAMRVPRTDPNYLMSYEVFKTSPIRSLSYSSQGGFNLEMAQGVVTMMNGHFFKGLKSLLMAI